MKWKITRNQGRNEDGKERTQGAHERGAHKRGGGARGVAESGNIAGKTTCQNDMDVS